MSEKIKEHKGRKKGTPNKKTLQIEQIFQDQNFSPAEGLAYCFREAIKMYQSRLKKNSSWGAGEALSIASKIANDAAQYVYPKRKAVEHTGKDGEKLMTSFADFIVGLEDKPPGDK